MEDITLVDYAHPEGYKQAKTEFIVFTEGLDAPYVFSQLLQVYKSSPQFRKLSMVAPVGVTSLSKIYGHILEDGFAAPKNSSSSAEPYAIQFGPVINSVIRRSALDKIDYDFTGMVLEDSVGLSLALWESGQMCYVAPSVLCPASNVFELSMNAPVSESTQKLFKREMVG